MLTTLYISNMLHENECRTSLPWAVHPLKILSVSFRVVANLRESHVLISPRKTTGALGTSRTHTDVVIDGGDRRYQLADLAETPPQKASDLTLDF